VTVRKRKISLVFADVDGSLADEERVLTKCAQNALRRGTEAPRFYFGGSAHTPPRRCPEPSQCAGQVNRLESIMATKKPSENMRGCNTVDLSRKSA
jgi:hypothetical protein